MAIQKTTAGTPSVIQVFNSSSNFVVPAGVTKVYTVARGAQGGNSFTSGGAVNGGYGITAASYVTVAPGGTYAVAVGAAGNNGSAIYLYGRYATNVQSANSGNSGGVTSFGTAVYSYGGVGATFSGAGANGNVAYDTTLPLTYPDGTQTLTSGSSTNNTAQTGAGQVVVIGWI